MAGRLGRYHSLSSTTFTIHSGDMALIQLQRGREELPLASAAQGLITPSSGEVRFERKNWATTNYEQQVEMRFRMGRVFDFAGWVSNLNAAENLMLAAQQHSSASDEALLDRANSWARRFGLDEIPSLRRAFLTPWKQRVLQWVRAFLNDPKLLLLERPGNNVPQAQTVVPVGGGLL